MKPNFIRRSPAKSAWLPATVALLISHAGIARALDANGNGISDVWESLHPAAAADLAADPDGDGADNRAEGIARTDPANAQSVFKTVDYGRAGDVFHFVYQREDWMRDMVHFSPNLLEWKRLAAPVQGITGPQPTDVPATGPRQFHSVTRLEPLNSDTDGLDNREEKMLGTNPLLWDTDGDKVPDDVEFLNGTNPLAAGDSDGDGLPDDWEMWIVKSDPNDTITSISQVGPGTDFDRDGVTDVAEFALGTSPVKALRNVILFLSEDQSVDLGCMGTVGIATPSVDSFAATGVLFEKAFALAPVCSPSKMAMFTGTYPHTNTGYRNVQNYGTVFPLVGDPSTLGLGGVHEDLPTLIEILRDRGFFTATSHKTHVQPVRKWPYSEGYGQPTTTPVARGYIDDLVTQAGNRPFYMTFGVGAPHLPFRGILQNQGLWSPTGGLTGDGHATNVDANAIVVPNCYPDVPGVRQDIADYYGAIQCVDTVFGAVLDELQIKGVLDETLVIYTSDHGIGLHRAKQSIYSTGTQIPFIVAGAGIVGNRRISAPISHLDVVPTLLDYLGIPKLPGMPGSSLMPILKGNATTVAGRDTVLTAAHDKYDGRGVCDGRYYYIRNIRKIAGASLADPRAGLNDDQFAYNYGDYGQNSGPWFNRTYSATLAATGSPGRQLLQDLLTGNVPDEELYDLDADLWCVNNLANDPSLAALKTKLDGEMGKWRRRTEDYNVSPLEMTRRTARYTEPAGGTGTVNGPPVVDDFNGRTDNLGAGPNWTTVLPGTAGADFALGGNVVDAPAGGVTLSRWGGGDLAAGGTFSVSVKTGFSTAGVGGGIAFGIVGNGFWQFLLADGRSAPGGTGKDIRLFRVDAGAQVNPPLLSVNNLPDYATDGALYTLQVSGTEGSSLVSLRALDAAGAVYYTNPAFDLGAPVAAGSGFGITSWSSTNSIFDDFALSLPGASRSVLLDFEGGTGNLAASPGWSLAIPGNAGADFAFVADTFVGGSGTVVDAPAGGQPPLAVYNPFALAAGDGFQVSVDTGFAGAGLFGGLAFGVAGSADFLTFELADPLTAASLNRLFRIRRSSAGTFSDLLYPAANSLPVATRNEFYRLTISGAVGQTDITYAVRKVGAVSDLASGTLTLPAPIAAGTKFGLVATTSGSSKYDRLSLSTGPGAEP